MHNSVDRIGEAMKGLNCLLSDIEREADELALFGRALYIEIGLDGVMKDRKLTKIQRLDVYGLKNAFDMLEKQMETLRTELRDIE